MLAPARKASAAASACAARRGAIFQLRMMHAAITATETIKGASARTIMFIAAAAIPDAAAAAKTMEARERGSTRVPSVASAKHAGPIAITIRATLAANGPLSAE